MLQFTPEMLPQIRADTATLFAQMAAGLPDFPDIAVTERRVPGPPGAPDVRVLVASTPGILAPSQLVTCF